MVWYFVKHGQLYLYHAIAMAIYHFQLTYSKCTCVTDILKLLTLLLLSVHCLFFTVIAPALQLYSGFEAYRQNTALCAQPEITTRRKFF